MSIKINVEVKDISVVDDYEKTVVFVVGDYQVCYSCLNSARSGRVVKS